MRNDDRSMIDLGGRVYRSQFPENQRLNKVHPSLHMALFGEQPDIVIYDMSKKARFPNGRALEDDVVDMVRDRPGLKPGPGQPNPSENEEGFLDEFPYIKPPN